MRRILRPALLLLACVPAIAHAWWSPDWSHRTKVVLNTTASGVETKQPVVDLPVALRLHSGNLDFSAAKPDGSDLRLVAGDDKTALKFHVEKFDSVNELAIVWVRLPTLAAGSDKNVVYAYYGNAAANAETDAAGTYSGSHLAVFHFGEADAPATDSVGGLKTAAPLAIDPNGLLGNAVNVGGSPIALAGGDRLKMAAGGAMSVSMWIKANEVTGGVLYEQGSVQLKLASGALAGQAGSARVAGGEVKPGQWHAVAMTIGAGKLTLFVDGKQVAQTDAALPELAGDVKVAVGFAGLLDELQIAGAARSEEFLRLATASAAAEGKLISANIEAEGEEASEGGEEGHFAILIKNLTTDAWVVIIILGIMFVIAAWVMVDKQLMLSRVKKANDGFMERFRAAGDDNLLTIARDALMAQSPLYTLYAAGVREIEKRFAARASVGAAATQVLGGASIDAIKAAVDADQVRENHKLNKLMVLLTIAISGGPFLGLLGTVVGVMITFAAIAAAGDVNVNAIAPGIAAALLATVAGLGVAIPSLFGYNWLAAQIKNQTADMQIFVDEFVTRVAEKYGD
ncbi:DUF2341 domain-containing protein [Viridibacterium curvum]